MPKSVVVTTTQHQHLRKVNILGAGVTGTLLPELGERDRRRAQHLRDRMRHPRAGRRPRHRGGAELFHRVPLLAAQRHLDQRQQLDERRRGGAARNRGGADQTGSGTASSPQGNLTATPAAAFDNDPATTWHSAIGSLPGAVQLVYDFGVGVAKTILQVMIQAHPSNAAYSPLAFDVQYSSDNSAWTTSWSVTTPNTWVGGEIRTFTKP
jgi:hypothetical protein